jgi:hypothetical protein
VEVAASHPSDTYNVDVAPIKNCKPLAQKAAVVICYEVISWHLPEVTEKTIKNITRMQSVSACIGIQDLPKTCFNGPTNLFWVDMLEIKIARKAFD